MGSSEKEVLGIFKMAYHLRDQLVFMQQLFETLNFLDAAIFKQVLWKAKTFFKKLEYRSLIQST